MKFLFIFLCFISILNEGWTVDEHTSLFDQLNSSPVLPTMIQYVVVPAVEAHGSYYLSNSKEFVDSFSRWQSLIQNWASHLSTLLDRFTKIKYESCAHTLLCSLGKAKFQLMREQKRSMGSRVITGLNSLFRLPAIEQKFNTTYLEAREFGASGANCDHFPLSNDCPISSFYFDQFFDTLKQIF